MNKPIGIKTSIGRRPQNIPAEDSDLPDKKAAVDNSCFFIEWISDNIEPVAI
jgi:hypothetical protein